MALQRKDASQLDGDQPGRRKPFVIVASVLMAVSMAIPLISPTLIALFIQTVLAALAFGIDGHVDQALFIDVLPDENAAGRDLGVANIATNLGRPSARSSPHRSSRSPVVTAWSGWSPWCWSSSRLPSSCRSSACDSCRLDA